MVYTLTSGNSQIYPYNVSDPFIQNHWNLAILRLKNRESSGFEGAPIQNLYKCYPLPFMLYTDLNLALKELKNKLI